MNDRHMSELFWAAKATLVAMLLYVAVEAVITPFQLDEGLKPQAVAGDERPQEEPPVEAPLQARPDYSVILDNDVFTGSGQAAVSDGTAAEPPTVVALPSAEKLGLKLRGIIAGSPIASRAIIEDTATKVAMPYKIGDHVASASVESIEPDRVILLHGGRKAVLQLHVGASSAEENPLASEEKPEPAPSAPVVIDRQQPQPSVRLGYVEELFRKATIKPVVKDGQTEGLEITGLEETPLTKLFGLRNGDVVQTVNGQNLNSKQKAFQVLKKARTQSKIDLQLLRDGKAKELSFDL